MVAFQSSSSVSHVSYAVENDAAKVGSLTVTLFEIATDRDSF